MRISRKKIFFGFSTVLILFLLLLGLQWDPAGQKHVASFTDLQAITFTQSAPLRISLPRKMENALQVDDLLLNNDEGRAGGFSQYRQTGIDFQSHLPR